jgi:hypothetical protein
MDNKFTPEIQQALMDMFATEGWQYFLEDVAENLKGANTLDSITGEQSLGFRQGQVNTLRSVLAYEDTIRDAVDNEAEETDDYEITLSS